MRLCIHTPYQQGWFREERACQVLAFIEYTYPTLGAAYKVPS